MSYAQKIFDMRHEIPEGMNPIIKKYPPLKLAIRMRAAGQRPVDPTVLEEWAAKQAAVAKSQDDKRRATEALTKLKDDLKKLQAKITASDKAKPKSAASGKNRAVVRKQLEEQVAELNRKIAEAEKEQSGAEGQESDE
jgi:septal ring factor EnvC (AmiA/AmiB activator)